MTSKTLTSVRNPAVKEALLLRSPRHRRTSGLTLVDGLREVSRMAEAGVRAERVFWCRDILPERRLEPALSRFLKTCGQICFVNETVCGKLAYGERQEGLVAVARPKEKKLRDLALPSRPFAVLAEGLEKPGNLGAVIRSCDAALVDALVLIDCATDVFNPNVIRASLGTVFGVPVARASRHEARSWLSKNGLAVYAASPDADRLYSEVSYDRPSAVVLGSESRGLAAFWLKEADERVRLPMRGRGDSLNVSVTAGIIIYEALRQRALME